MCDESKSYLTLILPYLVAQTLHGASLLSLRARGRNRGSDKSDSYNAKIIEWDRGNNLRRNYRVYFLGNGGLDQGKFLLSFFSGFGVKRQI